MLGSRLGLAMGFVEGSVRLRVVGLMAAFECLVGLVREGRTLF